MSFPAVGVILQHLIQHLLSLAEITRLRRLINLVRRGVLREHRAGHGECKNQNKLRTEFPEHGKPLAVKNGVREPYMRAAHDTSSSRAPPTPTLGSKRRSGFRCSSSAAVINRIKRLWG